MSPPSVNRVTPYTSMQHTTYRKGRDSVASSTTVLIAAAVAAAAAAAATAVAVVVVLVVVVGACFIFGGCHSDRLL